MRLSVLRATPVIAFAVVALGSVAILILDHRRVESTLEAIVAATDNLTQARLHAAQGLLAAERLRSGDATVITSRPLAEVNQAITLLDDLREGRSSVLGMTPIPLGARLDSLASVYVEELRALRAELAAGTYEETAVTSRIQASRIEGSAMILEDELFDRLRHQLAAEDLRHRFRLVAWILFLMVSGAAFLAARRERDRAEAALHTSERQYAALATHAAAGLLRTDRSGHVLESTGGWGTDSLTVGQPWWEALPQRERDRASELWATRSSRLDTFFLEVRHEGPDGGSRWMASRWARDGAERGGDGSSWIGTFIDETEHRLVEERLQQAQRLESVGRLTSGIAHDLNNFLAVIVSNVETLKRDQRVGPHGQELVAEIEAATQAGRDLVAGLTGFSRKASLDIQAVDLGEVVQASGGLARRLLPDSIELQMHIPASAPLVHADRRSLTQILLNLVSNARDAMPAGGTVRVEVDAIDVDEAYRDAHPWVELGTFGRITVTDTGTGMDPATLARVFDPFFTTKQEGKGTGLGMATAHGLVRQHGGHIHAYSEPGLGTTFRIYIPRASATPERATPTVDRVQNARGPSLGILLVDDDEVLRRTATRLLVRLGHQVVGASSGREALEVLEAGDDFDLIISDVSMGDMGGVELFEVLRARGREDGFVFTSGRSVQEVTERGGLPEGATYLAKPWTVDEIERAIEKNA